MNRDEETKAKPRRTPLVLWLLLATIGLALLLVGVSLFGPNPPIEIGKETTRITTPLAADGLPDYAAALLARGRIGKDGRPITPERNGAVPFLRAMWPEPGSDEAIGDEDAALLAAELGIALPPAGPRIESPYSDAAKLGALRLLRQRLPRRAPGAASTVSNELADRWYRSFDQDARLFNDMPLFADDEEVAKGSAQVAGFLDSCRPIDRPWTAEDLPFLARWMDRNRAAIDLFVEAAERPEWYLPPPDLIEFERGTGFTVSLELVQQQRDAVRTLYTRATHHLGEGRIDAAARDARAILRIGDHGRRGYFVIDQLVSCAIEGIGQALILHLLAAGDAPAERLRELAETLDATDSRRHLIRSYDEAERYIGLDTAMAITEGMDLSDLDLGAPMASLNTFAIDWNEVLRKLNAHYDAEIAAARAGSWSARQAALRDIAVALNQRSGNDRLLRRLALGGLTARGRGALMGDVWLALVAPATQAAFAADDRVTANRRLTRVAVALALYRHAEGDYPDTLDALVPALLPEAPVDLFHSNPLVYRRTDDGYLLYSLGANGKDDGGSREAGQWGSATYEGVEVEEPSRPYYESEWDETTGEYVGAQEQEDESDHPYDKIPAGADDLSLRMPPAVEPWPWEIDD